MPTIVIIPEADAHFTIAQRVEGLLSLGRWSDLGVVFA